VFPGERNMLGDLLFTEFLGGSVERASELSYDITLAMAHGSQSEESVYRRAVRNARVDAIMLSSPLIADPRAALLRELGMPFIIHGRTRTDEPYAYLDIDNEGAFHSATKLLTDLGHTRIALLNGEPHFNFAADRERGFRRALERRGINIPSGFICSGAMVEHSGFAHAKRLLQLQVRERPSAFLCSSVSQAAGVKRACSLAGLTIGQDLALIVHDDRIHDLGAESFDPPLTATQSSIGDAGRRVAELCIAMLRAPNDPLPQEIWPVDLVVRASTMPFVSP
jgi:LacI family transcriptional regulator